MTNGRDSLSERQKRKILQAARLCFIRLGLARATMRDIAGEAGMSLGNIYRYFKNKEALIEAFLQSDMQSVGSVFASLESSSDFNDDLAEIAYGFIKHLSRHSELVIYIDILSKALRDGNKQSLISLQGDTRALSEQLQAASHNGRISLNLEADTAAMTLIAFIESAAVKSVTRKNYSPKKAKDDFRTLLDLIVNTRVNGK